MMKWLRRAGAVLLLAVLVLVAGAAIYAQRALPLTHGTLEVAGVQGPVRIERDAHGIPTIRAGSIVDATFGLGFVHAQDRLWQMETHRRIGSGRLAEAFGAPALDSDRFLRALGVRRYAAAQLARLSGPARQQLDAYTAGVNAFINGHLRARPPEFVILGLQPQPWDSVDTLAWAIMMAWDLGGNWSNELLRMRLTQHLSVARINELLPPYPGEAAPVTADYAALARQWQLHTGLGRHAARAADEAPVEGLGSNNWVVGGTLTQSGKPLLANDPHLHLSAPALWYLARLAGPGFEIAGATLPGLPTVLLGQNQHIAWGFTNTGPDVQDLYLERIAPTDAQRYQTPDGWAVFERFDETIHVRGGADVALTVRATRHGPVLSDAGVGAAAALVSKQPGRLALALRWTALDPDPGTLVASCLMQEARSASEFVQATAQHVAPMQNMVVADAQGEHGHIAFVAAGRVPVRKSQNDLLGLVPAPGWDARYDWAGFVDAAATPREADPPRAWLASANQRITPPGYAHYLTSEWAWPYRFERIAALLRAGGPHGVASMQRMQADQFSLGAQPLLAVLKRAQARHALAAAAAPLIAAFDGTMAADAPGPAIFHVWLRHLTEAVLADDLGDAWQAEFAARSFREGLDAIVARGDVSWCDDQRTAAAETCADMANTALERALQELQQRLGSDPLRWRWGDLHIARADHRPFSNVPLLARWFELRAPVGGDAYTLNVARANLAPDARTGERYLNEHGPSYRAVYDLAGRTDSWFMHSSGQSGIAWSRHYRDFLPEWAAVRYVPVWDDTPPALRETLVLQPAP